MQHWRLQVGGVTPDLGEPAVQLLDDVLPRFRWSEGGFALSATYWLLERGGEPDRLAARLDLRSYFSTERRITWGADDPPADLLPFANAPQDALRLHGPGDVVLRPRGRASVLLTWHAQDDTTELVGGVPPDADTAFRKCYGAPYRGLSIPGQAAARRSYARMGELARGSLLASADGSMLGGFLGSDFDARIVNWTRDSFYAALGSSVTHPDLCARMIPFLLQWSIPEQCTARGLRRFPSAGPVTQSLSNSVAGICLAGAYLRSTGDTAWFAARPEFLNRCEQILTAVEQSRRQEQRMLFPSMFFSDGDARGDFHTGSNVAAWYAFQSAAAVARHSRQRPELVDRWQRVADAIRADLEHCCIASDPEPRFVEGANEDGSIAAGHDGEESETTLMPFYGFCGADDPRLLRHAKLAFTSSNPFYSAEIDGIWWFNEHWASATFPGWITHLAGASDDLEARQHLERIYELTDLDGSIWWWPYPHGSTVRTQPLRADGARKCAWAASVYMLTFLTKLIGLKVDALEKTVRLAPLSPWDQFSWTSLRFGATSWSLTYDRGPRHLRMKLVNETADVYTASLTGHVPAGKTGAMASFTRGATVDLEAIFYGREAVTVQAKLLPGNSLELIL